MQRLCYRAIELRAGLCGSGSGPLEDAVPLPDPSLTSDRQALGQGDVVITGGCGRGRRACCNMIGLNWGLQEVLQKFEQVDLTTEMSNGSLELYLVRTHTQTST